MTSARSAAATGLPVDYLDPFTLPEVYGLRISGKCMEPDYIDGSAAAFSTTIPFEHDDVVAVFFKPGILKVDGKPCQCIIKRIVMMPPPGTTFPHKEHPQSEVRALVMLGSNDKPDQILPIRCEHVLAIHKCIGRMPAEASDPTPTKSRRRRR